MNPVTWLRPEYQGREDELIHLAAGADLVGVTRSAVSNWAARHGNFPKIVMLAGPREKRTKWVVRTEFEEFARGQLAKKRGGPAGKQAPRRPRVEALAMRIRHHEAQVVRLAQLAQKQEEALRRTKDTLNRHKAGLKEARQQLAAEAVAVNRLNEA
ncbi:hypothetical protein [Streptomyces sp. NPDC050704]|uniref:hypothetical protein n=1 Tax=Streptomyces sp. NPDC050704 TaxID=3157219 RepID=UPI0034259A0B